MLGCSIQTRSWLQSVQLFGVQTKNEEPRNTEESVFEEARKAAKRRCHFYWVLMDEKDSSGSKGGSVCSVTQSCLNLCDCMDCSPPGSTALGDSLGKNTGVGCHACLREIFPIQGSVSGLPHCRWILYHLSCQGSRESRLG